MIVEQSREIIEEVNKAFIGKNNIIEKVLMTIYAGGHVLLEDCPGVGKTTLVLAFAKVLGLSNKRIQFTTDTLPSDITGFNMYNREKNQFEYIEIQGRYLLPFVLPFLAFCIMVLKPLKENQKITIFNIIFLFSALLYVIFELFKVFY